MAPKVGPAFAGLRHYSNPTPTVPHARQGCPSLARTTSRARQEVVPLLLLTMVFR